jgi:adenylate cyclase
MALDKEIRVARRLAAIFAADVAGYSRLVGQDETRTLQALRKAREVLDAMIEERGGRIANTAGDSVLAEFASVIDAGQCAIAAQRELLRTEGERPLPEPLRFRMAVHIGDIVPHGKDLLGDGVNVCARLQELADPGGVCFSGSAYEQIRKTMPLAFRDRGLKRLKNIDEPVRAYAVSRDAIAAPSPAKPPFKSWLVRPPLVMGVAVLLLIGFGSAAWWWPLLKARLAPPSTVSTTAVSGRPSLAVLPFANIGDDKSQEYFSDGITDDIINDLSKMAALFVISRTSTFSYKGKAIDARKVAAELRVQYVVEGSVQRAGERVRINTSLVDAASGGQLWSERYEGSLANVFGLQDEITRGVTKALAVRFTPKEEQQIATTRVDDPKAYDEFLKGWSQYQLQTPAGAKQAIGHFEKALQIDSNYSRAQAALAATYWQIASRFWSEEHFGMATQNQAAFKAEASLAKAQSHPTSLSHQVAAAMLSQQGLHDKAIEEGERAIEADPNDANAHVTLANTLTLAGKPQFALDEMQRAINLNPVTPSSYFYSLGLAQFGLEHFKEAATALEQAIALNPQDTLSYRILLATYGQLNRAADAERIYPAAERSRFGQDMLSIRGVAFSFPFKEEKDTERLSSGLRKANVPE